MTMDRGANQQPSRVYGAPDMLPPEIANILPQDSYSQLQLAFRISSHALNQKAGQLESEAQQLRQSLSQKTNQNNALEQRMMQMESDLNDSRSKHKMAVEATQKLVNERNGLINTVKTLQREVKKLEVFKRNLMNSLRDDDDVPGMQKFADGGSLASLDLSSDRLVSSVLASANTSPAASPGGTRDSMMGNGGANPLMGSPRQADPAPRSPQSLLNTSGASLSSSSPRIDGKEFFRQARARLSYEQFSQFLQNIKELNAGRQSREDTLAKAQDIFGPENSDLYLSFEGLLSRHLPAL